MDFVPIYRNVRVVNVQLAIARQDNLFSASTIRQDYEGSAHKETKCICLRAPVTFNSQSEAVNGTSPSDMRDAVDKAVDSYFKDLECEDRPEYDMLPEIRTLVSMLMSAVEGERLGSVSVVKLPPGASVAPHRDEGPYSEYYDRFHIAVSSPEGSCLVVEGDSLTMEPGSAWWFAHHKMHWAENKSDYDRIHIIVDIRARRRGKLKGE